MSAELIFDQSEQRQVVRNVCRLQSYSQQLEAHVHHGVSVVAIMGVGQWNQKAEKLP